MYRYGKNVFLTVDPFFHLKCHTSIIILIKDCYRCPPLTVQMIEMVVSTVDKLTMRIATSRGKGRFDTSMLSLLAILAAAAKYFEQK